MSLNVGVIGAGAMGTAISQCIAPNTNKLLLYARVSAKIKFWLTC